MYPAKLKTLKVGQLFILTTAFVALLLNGIPALSALKLIPEPLSLNNQTSQNVASGQTLVLQDIYVAEEGVALGFILTTANATVAVDASGSPVSILGRVPDNNTTVEYYRTGLHKGKLQRIDNINFVYYNSGAEEGKIRSIGNIAFTYYNSGRDLRGKIQSLGNIPFRYYNSGNLRGKLRSLGNINFTYNPDGTMINLSGTLRDVRLQTTSIESWRSITLAERLDDQ